MKESISPQERRLLAVIIMSGIYANSRYMCTQTYLVTQAVDLLNRLLTTLDKPDEV